MSGHDLRTPLNAVIGMSTLLLRTQLTAEQRELVETLHRSGLDILTAIDGQEAPRAETSPIPSSERTALTRGFRVLIVDDNKINRLVAQAQLDSLGYEADALASGEEALAALDEVPYGLVLMDCRMPGMDGRETTRSIREKEGRRYRVPIIALTANEDEADRELCLDAGMDDYLRKPARAEELDRALATHAAPVDERALQELRTLVGGSDAALEKLIREFLVAEAAALVRLCEARDSKDIQALGDAAHFIRGASGNFGAKRLSQLCGRLEDFCLKALSSRAFLFADAVEVEFARVHSRLTACAAR